MWKKYEYKNATVYITAPSHKQLERIRDATETFFKRITKERIDNEERERRSG